MRDNVYGDMDMDMGMLKERRNESSAYYEALLDQKENIAETNIFNVDGNDFITLEVPGFSKDDIDAYFEESTLIIEGSRDTLDEAFIKYTTQEFKITSNFRNKYQLGRVTEVDKISVKDGICKITLKTTEPKIRTLEIE